MNQTNIETQVAEAVEFYWQWALCYPEQFETWRHFWHQNLDFVKGVSLGVSTFSNMPPEQLNEFMDYLEVLRTVAWYHISNNPFTPSKS